MSNKPPAVAPDRFDRLVGRVQPGKGDASRWLARFNAAYAQKLGVPIFPGSLHLALAYVFDWSTRTAARDWPDPWLVEVLAAVPLRATYGLADGALVEVELGDTSRAAPRNVS